MQDFIVNIMNSYGYLGVFLLIMIENVFPPIPSEVILLFGGFMTTYTKLKIIGMVIASTLGSVVGALILYQVGKIFNKDRLKKIISGKIGKILRLKPSDIDASNHWFNTKGTKTVFYCRFIPVVRSLISIPAGISKMNMFTFLFYTILGSLIWNIVLIILGSILGNAIINSINTLLLILGTISIFLLITTILNSTIDLGNTGNAIINGIIEMSQGLKYVSMLEISLRLKTTLSVMIISFGGLSVHLQVMSILSNTKVKYLPFLLSRIIHALIAGLIAFLIFPIM